MVSGAILQLRAEFHLDCTQQEMVVSSMLMGAVLASLIGGNINCYEVWMKDRALLSWELWSQKQKESPNELVIVVQNALNCCWDNINQYVLLHVVDNIYIFQ